MGEPLGRSQVLAYLRRLAIDYEITLFSFEKPDADRLVLADDIQRAGINWCPLAYHKRPPVLSTLVDVLAGVRAMAGAARAVGRPAVVHVRSYVPALIALWARMFTGGKLLFDIRGFWVDERVEGGIWPQSKLAYRVVYRVAKRYERRFFLESDAIVTLTDASLPRIRQLTGNRKLPVDVIPTCVDLGRFACTQQREGSARLVWCGSVGTWYRFDLAVRLSKVLGLGLDVITRQTRLARDMLDGATNASVGSLPPSAVPGALRAGDVGLSLCVATSSKQASAPTRFAEYLAAGMPVIVNGGVGDLVQIVTAHEVGVVLEGESDEELLETGAAVAGLLADPELAQRCRDVARKLFDVEAGARRYNALYRRLLGADDPGTDPSLQAERS